MCEVHLCSLDPSQLQGREGQVAHFCVNGILIIMARQNESAPLQSPREKGRDGISISSHFYSRRYFQGRIDLFIAFWGNSAAQNKSIQFYLVPHVVKSAKMLLLSAFVGCIFC